MSAASARRVRGFVYIYVVVPLAFWSLVVWLIVRATR